MYKFVLVATLLVQNCSCAIFNGQNQEELTVVIVRGTVTKVLDGDSVVVFYDGDMFKGGRFFNVNLRGVDSPELDQPFGNEAKLFVEELLLNKEVEFDFYPDSETPDHVGGLILLNGESVAIMLLRGGIAWNTISIESGPVVESPSYAEANAKSNKFGLWSHPNPFPPWEWRQLRQTHLRPLNAK